MGEIMQCRWKLPMLFSTTPRITGVVSLDPTGSLTFTSDKNCSIRTTSAQWERTRLAQVHHILDAPTLALTVQRRRVLSEPSLTNGCVMFTIRRGPIMMTLTLL